MNPKIKWLRDKIRLSNMDGIIISNPVNIKYLTGINAEGTLLVTRKENYYITDSRYIEYAKSVITINDGIIVYNMSDISREDYENFFLFCDKVGFEENYVTYFMYKLYMQRYKINNLEETENIIEKQRMIKDEEEIGYIEKACKITDACFSHLLNFIKIGMTEKEIAFEIEKFFIQNGADGVAFETIVASGKNSSKPHAVPTSKKIEAGDAITIDMGCKYKGYCSDMTRTVFLGNVSEEQKKVYNIVKTANERAIAAVKPGVRFCDVDAAARDYITEQGYGPYFVHRTGHNIGQEVHEAGDVSSANTDILKPGMTFSIEPGIYLTGNFGVRVEDLVLVTEDGCKVLNHFTKDIIVVPEK